MAMLEHGDTSKDNVAFEPVDEQGLPEDVTATNRSARQTQAGLAAGEDSQPIEEIADQPDSDGVNGTDVKHLFTLGKPQLPDGRGDDTKKEVTAQAVEPQETETEDAMPAPGGSGDKEPPENETARMPADDDREGEGQNDEEGLEIAEGIRIRPGDVVLSEGTYLPGPKEMEEKSIFISDEERLSIASGRGEGNAVERFADSPFPIGGYKSIQPSIVEGGGYKDKSEAVEGREGTNQQEEVHVGDVVVEHRQVGPTPVVAVLAPHDMQRATEIAAAVKDCGIVVIGMDRYDTAASRNAHELTCNILASRTGSSNLVDMASAQISEHLLLDGAIAQQLPGSNNRVILASRITTDQDAHMAVTNADLAEEICRNVTLSVPSVEEGRRALFNFAEAQAEVIKLEEEGLSRELKGIVEIAGRLQTSVGVVLPADDFGVVESLGGEASQSGGSTLEEKATQSLWGAQRAVLSMLRDDIEGTVQAIDRTLYALYTNMVISRDGLNHTDAVTRYAADLDTKTIEQGLAALTPRITNTDMDFTERMGLLADFVEPIEADMRRRGYL